MKTPYRISKEAMADLKRRAAAERQAEDLEPFTLNPEPKPTFWKAPKQPKAKQAVLFSGLDCLAGQLDLINDLDGAPAQ